MSELRTEALLLLEAIQAQLAGVRGPVPEQGAGPDTDSATSDSGSAGSSGDQAAATCPQCAAVLPTAPAQSSCPGCPVCTVLAVLRGERPELAATLLDGAISMLGLLRGALAGSADTVGSATSAHRAHDTAAATGSATVTTRAQPAAEPARDPLIAARNSAPADASPTSHRRPTERIRIS